MPRPFDPEMRMSLFEHLGELRSRLVRCVLAIGVLGVVSLIFARPIFGLLMRPVLMALPPEGRSLVYTSGIEEINVLMKVGLYAGIFLSTPVILWQLWGFVAPGLYPSERRYASPFVLFGSAAFLAGALFCYFGLLPTMFQFLLQEGDSGALQQRLDTGRLAEQEALRFVRLGDLDRAAELAKSADQKLTAEGEGKADSSDVHEDPGVHLHLELEGMGRLVDAVQDGTGLASRPVVRKVLEERLSAIDAQGKGDLATARKRLEDAVSLLAGAAPVHGGATAQLWKLEKDLALGKARYTAQTWTRPMLTMSEQLSLVLILELAFGVIFELPLVMALLALVGIVKASWLMKYQRHAFVVCLIVAAIITPTGDAVNLALMAGPMLACFELGVLAVWMIEKRKAKAAATTAITPAS